ncbi:MAG: RdgB/HAM1 family non-canonical purine NTP pyrophosphatase [Bacillota bacterium]
MRRMLIATGNPGKIVEIKKMYEDLNLEIVSPLELGLGLQVEETGETLEANALLKAKAGAEKSGLLTLADDTGLFVEGLDGRPGVRSARFAGEEASDQDNVRYLLALLEDKTAEEKEAKFITVAALYDPQTEEEITVAGVCPGRIISTPRGSNGFGYDPVFYLPEKERTFAELSLAEKNEISHRSRALKKMKKVIDEQINP